MNLFRNGVFVLGFVFLACSGDPTDSSEPQSGPSPEADGSTPSRDGGGDVGEEIDGGFGRDGSAPGADGQAPSPDSIASALNGLDPTGKTIPDSDYAVPSGAVFMSTTGSDDNPGTQAAPVKTLNKAVSLLPGAGGTIVVRGGTDAAPSIYRDWFFYDNAKVGKTFGVVGKPITLQAYPHEKAWFDGTDEIPTQSWTSDGAGHWSIAWSTPSFCGTLPTATESNYYKVSLQAQRTTADGPCGYHDSSLDPTNPMAIDPQMVFLDGVYVPQVVTLAEATGNKFYYDWSQKRLYLGFNPAGHAVELAARPMAMQLNGAGSKVLGLGFRRYASHQYPNNPGAIYAGERQTFENVVFTQQAGLSLMFGKPKDGLVNRAVFANNGGTGLGGSGSNTPKGTTAQDNLVIQNSIFSNNNTEKFWTGCSYSCGYGAIKLAKMVGFVMRSNLIEDTQGSGLGAWCDMGCTNGQYLYNVVRNNGGSGILHEISDTGLIASNLVYGNGGAGIRVCSANTKIYNNTVVNNGKGGSYIQGNVWIYDDPRSASNPDTANTGASVLGPDTAKLEYANNVLVSDNRMNNIQGTSTASTNTVPSQFFDVLDYNAYYRSVGANQVLVRWSSPEGNVDFKSIVAFTAAHAKLDVHSVDIASGGDPFFVDGAGGDYRLRQDHQAGAGTKIPADVARALGLSSGDGAPKGAISWPGKR